MSKACVTISIDLELAWGNWDNLSRKHISHIEQSERRIVRGLLDIFDRYDLSVTWATVAALLDPQSAKAMGGSESIWYAPDVIEGIRSAQCAHEIGSHGGRHRYFDQMSVAEAEDDLAFARDIHAAQGLPFTSFVFPRNMVAKTDILARHGLAIYRGEDRAWHQNLRQHQPVLGRMANLIDKMMPIAPEAVTPERQGDLVNLPGSLLFFGREGVRKFASSRIMERKLSKGVERAMAQQRVFHLWFHPSNFWHDTEKQFANFGRFAAMLAARVEKGEISVKPMASFV